MKQIVVMPTLKRPEMLALSLEKLAACNEPDLDVRIFLDCTSQHRLDEVQYVRDEYYPEAEVYHANNHILVPSGCWNILHSLKAGWESGADLVYLLEEDCMPRLNFFERHREMQESGDYFVTSGRMIPKLGVNYFTNPGSCYRREKLAMVVPHITDKFFSMRQSYLDNMFGVMEDAGNLDDGLIRRVMLSTGGKALCADPRIVAHQGFHYFNKIEKYSTSGMIKDRIVQLRAIIASIDPSNRYTRDFEPF